MNPPKCDEYDYMGFLIAAQWVYSNVEALKTHPAGEGAAHDVYTGLLQRELPDSHALWTEGEPLVDRLQGMIVIDDRPLYKPYASAMVLVTHQWSGM